MRFVHTGFLRPLLRSKLWCQCLRPVSSSSTQVLDSKKGREAWFGERVLRRASGSRQCAELRRGVRRAKSGAAVLQLVGANECDESVFGCAVRHCWHSLSDFESARVLFDSAKGRGKVDAICLSIFVNVCAESRNERLAFAAFDSLKATVQMDAPVFGALIKCCQHSADVRRALNILNSAPKKDAAIYTSVLKVCAKAADMKSALKLLAEIETVTLPIVNEMLKVCLQCDEFAAAERVDKMRRDLGIETDAIYWLSVAQLLAKCGHFQKAKRALDKAQNQCDSASQRVAVLSARIVALNAELQAAAEKRKVLAQILAVFGEIESIASNIPQTTLRLLLSAHLSCFQWFAEPLNFFQQLLADGRITLLERSGALTVKHYSETECRFALRYFFCLFPRAQMSQIAIVCGRNRQTVTAELASWTPPIRTFAKRNGALLVCDSNDTKRFFKTNAPKTTDFCGAIENVKKS